MRDNVQDLREENDYISRITLDLDQDEVGICAMECLRREECENFTIEHRGTENICTLAGIKQLETKRKRANKMQEYSLTAEYMQISREEFYKDAMTQDTVSQVYTSQICSRHLKKLSANEWHRYTEKEEIANASKGSSGTIRDRLQFI